uniref:Uncharacterized protein n=1 Tax=Rhizophora mucronata TaxID=61149 RepID=A0A2P2M7P5_RHIMU
MIGVGNNMQLMWMLALRILKELSLFKKATGSLLPQPMM